MSEANDKTDIGRIRWTREIEPICKMAKRRGFTARLTRELNRISQGRKWHRQQVDRYLHADPEQRSEPMLGLGLVLIEAARRVNEAMDAKAAKEEGKD